MKAPFVFFVFALFVPSAVHAQTPRTALWDASHHAANYLLAGRLTSDAERVQAQAAAAQSRSWPDRHPVLMGTLIGLGVGIPIGAATCRFPTAEGSSCGDYTYPGHARVLGALTLGGVGAGVGAGTGALVALARR